MLRKIYEELVLIRKELQAIRSSKESNVISPVTIDGKEVARATCQALSSTIRGIALANED